jgi:predicted DNA-binding transcriptional regulator AlpA
MIDDRYLTLAEVCDIVKRGKTWIYARVARGEFPRPDEGRWFYSEVMEYLAGAQAKARCGPAPVDPCNHPKASEPTCLYRHWSADGELLYVGVSLSVLQRAAHHKHCSPWFREIARIDIEWFPTRGEALRAERSAIWREKPRHNQVHRVGYAV